MDPKVYLREFENVARGSRDALETNGMKAFVGWWHESAVLKLQKPHWTEAAPGPGPTTEAGVFCSVWIEAKGLKLGRVFYNTHALYLRKLSGYRLESTKFAAAFRERFRSFAAGWPNVAVDFGPQTLMQGWVALDSDKLENDIAALADGFIRLSPVIDELLMEKRR